MVNATACLGCFTACFCIILIVSLSLFGASFKIVEFNQVALKKNKFSLSIDSANIYFSGRYFSPQLLQLIH